MPKSEYGLHIIPDKSRETSSTGTVWTVCTQMQKTQQWTTPAERALLQDQLSLREHHWLRTRTKCWQNYHFSRRE